MGPLPWNPGPRADPTPTGHRAPARELPAASLAPHLDYLGRFLRTAAEALTTSSEPPDNHP
ncbi:hypothetical protein JK358_13065 [Nocardia sp. 2]|uniref:Uncharacterized protein n=1 Tax=Nocardia acididurans TaxID=2802282 RepID=A0ABS1M570_9NOCA|nr:hypothetical protein [Nocardia acididurans]MBL1075325.1 hypothetical protein [Nocardia acididurans]